MSCGSDMTQTKSSSHWEGGQGCRNKVKMSKEAVYAVGSESTAFIPTGVINKSIQVQTRIQFQ